MTSSNRIKSNRDVVANFSLTFRDWKFLMKIKFPSYVTRRFLSLFNNNKIPEYSRVEFKFHLKFRVTSLKKSLESLRKVLCKQL